MPVPEQIKKQSKAIQEFYQELHGEGDDANVEEKETVEVKEEKPPVVEDHSDREDQTQKENWEQKYRTLQGMYNVQNAEAKNMRERVAHLEALLGSIKNQPAPTPKEEPKPKTKPKYITDSEVEEYGGSIDVMRKAAREEADELKAELEEIKAQFVNMQKAVIPRVENVARQQHVSAEQAFWGGLNARVPNWQQVNDSAEFKAWLVSTDPKTGISLQTYLDDAQDALDVERVAAFFDEWTAISGGSNREAPQPKTERKSELEKQVAPGRGRTQTPKQGDNKTNYTRADVTKFYDDVTAGRFKGKDQERARIEADIFAAMQDGRLT